MSLQTVHLDLTGLTADQQVARLKEQHVLLRGKGLGLVRLLAGLGFFFLGFHSVIVLVNNCF